MKVEKAYLLARVEGDRIWNLSFGIRIEEEVTNCSLTQIRAVLSSYS